MTAGLALASNSRGIERRRLKESQMYTTAALLAWGPKVEEMVMANLLMPS